MLAKHKASGELYRMMMRSFSTERQRPSMVYMKLATGQVFDRDEEEFKKNFDVLADVQSEIVPRDQNQTEMELVAVNEDGTRDYLAQQIR